MEVKLPSMGENVTEATVSFWYRKEGETVRAGEDLVELATEKTSFNLPAPGSGRLTRICVSEGAAVKVEDTLAIIE